MDRDFQDKLIDRLARIETKLDELNCVPQTVYDLNARSKKSEEEIKEMKDNNKWLWRTVFGNVIALIFGVIITFFKLNKGG